MCRVGWIYAFRYGGGHEFKIGITIDLDRRRKELQTGSPRTLTLLASIEHPAYREGETFLKRRLAANKLEGGKENFELSDDELIAAMAAARVYMDEEVPLRQRVRELSRLESTSDMLPGTDRVRSAYARLLELRVERAELDERKGALMEEERTLADEEDRLKLIVMDSIGAARGIDGVATWETIDGRRKFDEEWLKSDEPELFEAYRTKFDATRFRKEHREEHAAHMRVTRVRRFHLLG